MVHSTLPDSRRLRRRPGVCVFAGLIAFSAYAGAIGLISGWLRLDDTAATRLPFSSPVLGGLALAVIVAVPATWLAWLAWRGDPRIEAAELLTGGLLMGWIIVELAFIREFSFFHPLYLANGVILVWLGRHGTDALRTMLTNTRG